MTHSPIWKQLTAVMTWACRAAMLTGLTLVGCVSVDFPVRPDLRQSLDAGGEVLKYDMDGDGAIDYRQVCGPDGRVRELQFVDPRRRTHESVRLDALPPETPHVIIALDGVPFEVLTDLRQQGAFRLFYPAGRVVSCFPGLTDLAFARLFDGPRPLAFEAEYYDPDRNRVVGGGSDVYLSGANAGWARQLDYRCSFFWDGLAYLNPRMVFDHELDGMRQAIARAAGQDRVVVYSVATAGLATRGGRAAIETYLHTIDRFCEQLVYQRRGRVKLTLVSDHGHNLTGDPGRRVSFKRRLEQAGYRVRNRLETVRDVVVVEYGLVTAASLYTADAARVAEVLLEEPAVALACYRDGDRVVVQSTTGKALIDQRDGHYRYDTQYGDPLELAPVLAALADAGGAEGLAAAVATGAANRAGWYADRDILQATATAVYPDPLKRIWETFHGLAANTPDLVVTIRDGWYHGDTFFDASVGHVASTHGGLNRVNSTTVAMTMWGPLPGVLRLEEVLDAVEQQRRAAASADPTHADGLDHSKSR